MGDHSGGIEGRNMGGGRQQKVALISPGPQREKLRWGRESFVLHNGDKYTKTTANTLQMRPFFKRGRDFGFAFQ